jgi:hypothetical protein
MIHSVNNKRLTASAIAMLCLFCLLHPGTARAVSVGQIDDFEDGTLQGWMMGSNNITATHMTNITDGGPAGVGDNFLQVVSHETEVTGGGRLAFFNKAQWTGDYLGAGITAIAMDVNNFSSSEALNLRLAINGGFLDSSFNVIGGLFATSASVSLGSGRGWVHVVFSLVPGDLTAVSGRSGTTGNNVLETLANVTELRLLNSANPDWTGPLVSATLGIDNVWAVPLPPAALLFGSGLVGLGMWRRRGF